MICSLLIVTVSTSWVKSLQIKHRMHPFHLPFVLANQCIPFICLLCLQTNASLSFAFCACKPTHPFHLPFVLANQCIPFICISCLQTNASLSFAFCACKPMHPFHLPFVLANQCIPFICLLCLQTEHNMHSSHMPLVLFAKVQAASQP